MRKVQANLSLAHKIFLFPLTVVKFVAISNPKKWLLIQQKKLPNCCKNGAAATLPRSKN
jgi:hypothetical protein